VGSAPRAFATVAAIVVSALAPACYRLPEPDCGFVCGAGGACPADYTCGADNVCRRTAATSDAVCPKADAAPDALDAALDAAPDAP
jgi:hypothetical protein